MIAPNGNGRATETRSVTPPVVIATAGRGAVNHSPEDNRLERMRQAEGLDSTEPPLSYDDRREAYTGWVVTDLFDGEPGYFVDSRLDGEPRDGDGEDVS